MGEVKIGRKYRSHLPNAQVAEEISDAFLRLSIDHSVDQIEKTGAEIAKRMTSAGNRELEKIGGFMATSLMGLSSRTRGFTESRKVREYYPKVAAQQDDQARSVLVPASLFKKGMPTVSKGFRVGAHPFFSSDKLPSNGLRWKPLALKTERRKKNSSLFVDKSNLQSYFAANASSLIMEKTGGVQVVFHRERVTPPQGGKISFYRQVVGALEITIAPKKITAYNLPALATGNWTDGNDKLTLERSLFPRSIVTKLGGTSARGSQPWFRPLVQPTLAFWLLHRVPRALAAALNSAMRMQTRSSGVRRDFLE